MTSARRALNCRLLLSRFSYLLAARSHWIKLKSGHSRCSETYAGEVERAAV